MTNSTQMFWRGALAVALWSAVFVTAQAQLPSARLDTVFPPGAAIGAEVEVKITGQDLDDVDALIFSHSGIQAAVKMGEPSPFYGEARPLPNEFIVTVAGNVPPGTYEVRAQGKYGVSNPRSFIVGRHESALIGKDNSAADKAIELPPGSVVFGQAQNSRFDYYTIPVEKGQRIIVECWAERIDSKMDATLELLDSNGRLLAKNRDRLRRDSLIDYRASDAGVLTLKVYDFLYEGGGEYFYRLAVDSRAQVDFVFPPSGEPGKKGKFTLYGRNLPGGTPVESMQVDGAVLEKLDVEIQVPSEGETSEIGPLLDPSEAEVDGFVYRLETSEGPSNPLWIGLASAPVVAEQEPNDEEGKAQVVSPPCEYVGQAWPVGDVDWVEFEAKQGDAFWIEVFSQRLGLPTDLCVLVQKVTTNDDGEVNVRDVGDADDQSVKLGGPGFDRPSTDPAYHLRVDEDATYRVLVRDLYGDSVARPRNVYRLVIRPAQPDFRLIAEVVDPQPDNNKALPWNPLLRRGETIAVKVHAFRREGFDGDIELGVEGLPGGVTALPTTIAASQVSGEVVLQASDSAGKWTGPIKIVGKATIGDKQVTRQARGGMVSWEWQNNRGPISVRMTRDITLSVSEEVFPVTVTAGDNSVLETARAGKLTVPVKVSRREGAKGNLSLDPVGVPKELKVDKATVNEKETDGKLEVTVDTKLPAGTYSFHVQGTTKYNYSRNPQAVEAAQADQKKIEEIAKQMAEAKKQADMAQQAAEKKASDTANAAKQQADEVKKLDEQLAEAKKQVDAAQAERDKAKAAAEAKADDQGLKDAAAAAEKKVAEADAAHKDATAKLDQARKQAEQAASDAKTAEEEKVAAVEAAQAAAELDKQAQEEKKRVDKLVSDLTNAAKPKDINLLVVSTPVVVRVYETPIEFSAKPAGGPLKQSGKVQLAVETKRRFDYDEPIDVELVLPKGVSGVKAEKLQIAKGQSSGQIELEAGDKATPGEHIIQLRARMKFNGQNLEETVDVPLVVEAVEPPAEEK